MLGVQPVCCSSLRPPMMLYHAGLRAMVNIGKLAVDHERPTMSVALPLFMAAHALLILGSSTLEGICRQQAGLGNHDGCCCLAHRWFRCDHTKQK